MAIRLKLLMPPKSVFPLQVWLFEPNIYCLEPPQEFSEVHKIAVHILVVASLVSHANLPMLRCMNIVMMVGTPVKLLSPSVLEACVPVLQQLQMQHRLLKGSKHQILPVPIEIGKATAVDSGCACISCCLHWIQLLTVWRDVVEPSFYTSIIVSPEQYRLSAYLFLIGPHWLTDTGRSDLSVPLKESVLTKQPC